MRSRDQQIADAIFVGIMGLATVCLIAVGLAFSWVGYQDLKHEQEVRDHYCKMVAIWKSEDHLPPDQRAGWPPYKGDCDGTQQP